MKLAPEEFASAAAEVAAHAAGLIRPGMRLGLGSGRMASAFIEALRPRIASGLEVKGLCASEASEALARDVGIELLLASGGVLDLDVDGADEFDTQLNLIKGGGGALLREKVVAQSSRRFWVLADSSKEVGQLGSTNTLPVEVLPFDWEGTAARCQAQLSCRSERRRQPTNEPFVTDNGNFLLDLHFETGMADPREAASRLGEIAGVLGHGLFLGLATAAIVFDQGTVRVLGQLDQERIL
ncbi:MAG TPA: ribose 5-phosphate isomerase A [Candidatus Nanopelagicaceae bacterium]|nr:ribose 5-phosphate isomerase A [Candidatus Nanopelagicaceae bacterium]